MTGTDQHASPAFCAVGSSTGSLGEIPAATAPLHRGQSQAVCARCPAAESPPQPVCTATAQEEPCFNMRENWVLRYSSAYYACPENSDKMGLTCESSLPIVSHSSHSDTLRAASSPTVSQSSVSVCSIPDETDACYSKTHHLCCLVSESEPAHSHLSGEMSQVPSSAPSVCFTSGAVQDANSECTLHPIGSHMRQPAAFLLPPGMPACRPTITFFGSTEECTRLAGTRPTVKFGGIANRAIRHAFWSAGFQETTGADWNVLWGSFLHKTALRNLKPYQKCNHWPGTWELGRKDLFYQYAAVELLCMQVCHTGLEVKASCRNVARMRRIHGKIFDIIPLFYMLPGEWDSFQQHVKRSPGSVWIRKPLASSRGRGVRVVAKPIALSSRCKKAIVQLYIDRPLCVNGFKFDLRVYVAVTSIHPLRAYLFTDALVRFASVKYDTSKSGFKNRQMHLTNHAVNKNASSEAAHPIKWPLHKLWDHLSLQGKQDCHEVVWRQVEELCALALLAVHSQMSSQVMCCTNGGDSCFEIFGADLILTQSMIAKLLEVNTCPALSCNSDVDQMLKFPMLSELLHIVGIYPAPKNEMKRMPTSTHRNTADHHHKISPRGYKKSSAGDHARRWRSAPLDNIDVSALPKEIRDSEAEWSRMSRWAPCLPPVRGSQKLREIYDKMHWTHEMLTRWIVTRSQTFPSATSQSTLLQIPPMNDSRRAK
eukprot:jgi/Ulvmu1/3365/UM156_0022.1